MNKQLQHEMERLQREMRQPKDEIESGNQRTIISPLRSKIFNHANGKCVYCGKELELTAEQIDLGKGQIDLEDFSEQLVGNWATINYPSNYMEIDHKFPRARGGRGNIDNLVASCRECNQEKLDHYTYEEFMELKNGTTG
mgnify:CR=1 FL=1